MAVALVVEQPSPGADLDDLAPALTAAFVELRAALLAQQPVVVVLDDRDLLGQGEVVDAAIATGLLGMARTCAIEGGREGWCVNSVSHRGERRAPEVEAAIEWVGSSGLSGQLIRIGLDQLGKVSP